MIPTFQITSISGLEPFETEQKVWILAEKGTMLTVERSENSTRPKKREFEIPDKLFENNTFSIRDSCNVGKFFLSATATKGSSNNLEIKITSFDNTEYSDFLNFNEPDSIVEILQDSNALEKIKEDGKREIARLLKFDKKGFSDEEKTKYSNQIYENLNVFLNFQKFGELQNIDDWEEDKNIKNSLDYIEKKLKEIVNTDKYPLFEIHKK